MSWRRSPYAGSSAGSASNGSAARSPSNRWSRFSNTADAGVAARQNGEEDSGILGAISALFEGISKWWRSLSSTRQARAMQEPPTDAAVRGLEALRAMKSTQYTDPAHEDMLKELWGLLGEGKPYERVSPNWGDVGFQGKDPATDFRGQGLLGLTNILFLAQSHPNECLRMIQQHSVGFPFSIAVINISLYLIQLLEKYPGAVSNWLFVDPSPGTPCDPVTVFNHLFVRVFRDFEAFYAKEVKEYLAAGGNPAFVIMQFNPIKDKFNEVVEAEVAAGSFQTTQVAEAVRAAASSE